ncbi:MAG: ABC transporter ATP-binding protein [Candidatus Binatia bacterium]
MSARVALAAHNVTRVLAGTVPVTLVRDINVAIAAGEFVAITGPSGSGKSSLLYLLGLLDTPTTGRIFLDGEDTSHLSVNELAALRLAKLGFVFQFHFLLPEFTALGNVMIPLRKQALFSEEEIRARATALLDGLGLATKTERTPDQLSGGERQRVAIARALANDPLVLLADEPTGNLDSKNGELVFDIFEHLVTEEQKTVIVVTHDPVLAGRTQRQIHLVDGRITD